MKSTGAPRRISRAALVAAALAAALALLPGSASAAAFHPCSSGSILSCGRVIVPIDPTGAVKGSMAIHVELLHTSGPNHGAVVALAGGPGQAATPLLPDFAATLAPVLRGRDLVVFDQRGTGFSDQLLCPGLGDHKLPDNGVGGCAQRLGALRPFYTTSDSVADLDAVRRLVGVDKIDLYGVSYGTKVALDYATRFPEHIDRLVLDSVVLPGALDPYELSSFVALPRLLSQICAKNACQGITNDPQADLAQLVQRLESSAPTGFVVNGKGQRRKADLRRSGILSVLFEGDFDPTLRADFPAAVRAALNGDPAPMLRLVAATTGAETFDPSGGDSQALFLATSCEDASLPWSQSATPAQRMSESRQSFGQIAPSSYAPFDPDTVFNFSLAPFCANWPESGDSPPVESAPPPAVPTLILSGDDDLRTPQEDAARVAALLPKATLVRVPNVGHSVLGDDLSSCSLRAVQHFFRGEPQGICQSSGALFPPSPVPPRSISQLPAFRHQPQKVGRTLTATEFTLDDLFERLLDGFLESPDGFSVAPMGGLRAGFFTTGSKAITLHGYSWVPGVVLSGKFPTRGVARLEIGGASAARGTVTIDRHGVLRGRLGGHRVSVRLGSQSVGAARAAAAHLASRQFTPFLSSVLPPG
ncbi:MAG: alpha/beta hydrolase [Thermoleophilaceae bacterium]